MCNPPRRTDLGKTQGHLGRELQGLGYQEYSLEAGVNHRFQGGTFLASPPEKGAQEKNLEVKDGLAFSVSMKIESLYSA